MNNKWVLRTTFILSLLGALSWLQPTISDFFKKSELEGKIISRYNNLNKDKTQSMFLFKLSIYAKNKSFNNKSISCEMEFLDGEKYTANARNNRSVIFAIDNKFKKLILSGERFLNNFSIFPYDKNIDGYLFFLFNGDLEKKLLATTFTFEAFDGTIQKLRFQETEIQEEQLFFDDEIWRILDKKELQEDPAYKNQ